MRVARRSLVLGGVLAWLASVPCGASEGERRQLRFTMTLRNPGTEALADQTVWLYMPLRETATQRLEGISASMPHELTSDDLGHRILKLTLPHVQPMATKVVVIQSDVSVHREVRPQALKSPADWLHAERFIESDESSIRELAAQLKQPTPGQTLDAIYDWVRTNLRYAGYVADTIGAQQALARRSGDCTEYACLVAALARANGIPARMVSGYVAAGHIAPRADEYHDWTEVYLDGAWCVLDAQKECWRSRAEDYVGFRIHLERAVNALGQAHRFRVDGGLEVRL